MSHEYRYRQVEIPELDHFLAGYRALCDVHGMQFRIEHYDGGGTLTIEAFDGELPYLDLDAIDRTLPFVKRLNAIIEEIRDKEDAEDREKKRIAAEERDVREYARLKAKFDATPDTHK